MHSSYINHIANTDILSVLLNAKCQWVVNLDDNGGLHIWIAVFVTAMNSWPGRDLVTTSFETSMTTSYINYQLSWLKNCMLVSIHLTIQHSCFSWWWRDNYVKTISSLSFLPHRTYVMKLCLCHVMTKNYWSKIPPMLVIQWKLIPHPQGWHQPCQIGASQYRNQRLTRQALVDENWNH